MRSIGIVIGMAGLTMAISGCIETIKPVGDDGLSETTCYPIMLTPTEAACRAQVLKRCGSNGKVVNVREATRPRYINGIGWTRQSMWVYQLQGCGSTVAQSKKKTS